MSDPQLVERDLREYFEKEENLRKEDKIKYLRAIFDKHFAFTKLDHMVNSVDLYHIMSDSKSKYSKLPLPMFVSGRKMDATELPTIATIEALVGYLNRNHLLKKLVKIDYKD